MPISSQWGGAPWGSIPWAGTSAPPPGTIQLFSVLPINVEFGPTALSLALSLQYVLPINIEFGPTAVIRESGPITVFIDGVQVQPLANSLSITNPLSQASTASFSIWDKTGTLDPQVGQTVQIFLSGVCIFGGTIDQPFQTSFQAMPGSAFLGSPGGSGGTSSATGGGGGAIHCTDFSLLLSRRFVGLYFDGNNPVPSFLTDIVTYIIDTYLSADGFTLGQPLSDDPGINLGPVLFNWVTVQAAFNTLSSMTGWEFSVDPFKVIRFYPAGSGQGSAPFNIADNDGNVYAESLGIEYFRSQYRNRQGVASPSQQGQLWQDIYSTAQPGPFPNFNQAPNGIRKTYIQLYGFTAVPTVTVNGVPQIVAQLTGSGFVPLTGWQWYIVQPNQGGFGPSYGLFQFGGDAPLSSGDVLIIEYPTPLSPILWIENAPQIAARQAIEGGSGVYEDVQQATSVTDPAQIAAYAAGLLARYSNGIPFQVTYASRTQKALFAGMLQTIVVANPAVSFTGIISNVTWQDVDGMFMQLAVTVQSAQYQGDWTQFFAALVQGTALAQPANTASYSWTTGPNFDPGDDTILQPTYVTKNAVEAPLVFTVFIPPDNPIPPGGVSFRIRVNGSPWGGGFHIDAQTGATGVLNLYPPTQGTPKTYQGDVIELEIFFGNLFQSITNVSIQLQNVVLNT